MATTKVLQDGIWTWPNRPIASLRAGKLIFCSVNQTGRPQIAQLDLENPSDVVVNQRNLITSLDIDDHCNPAILPLRSGRVLVCTSDHNGSSYTQRSGADGDIRSLTETLIQSGTEAYAQLWQDANDRVWWSYRVNNTSQYIRYSDDDGATWSAGVEWLENGTERPYPQFAVTRSLRNRLDFSFLDGHPDAYTTSIWHGYMLVDASGNPTWYKSDGTLVGDAGDLPLNAQSFTRVYNGTTKRAKNWQCRVFDGGATPAIVFVIFDDDSSETDHRYNRALWNGSSWNIEEITPGGSSTPHYLDSEPSYSGGICFHPTNYDSVYLSYKYGANDFRIERWDRGGGGTWSKAADVSGNVSATAARPVAVSYKGTVYVLWWQGTYTGYTTFDTGVWIDADLSVRSAIPAEPVANANTLPPGSNLYLPLQEGSGTPADLLGNVTPAFGGTPTWGVDAYGWYLDGFSASDYLDIDALAALWTDPVRWAAVMFAGTDTTASQYLLSLGLSSNNNYYWGLKVNSPSLADVTLNDRSGGSPSSATVSGTSCNDGNPHVAMGINVGEDKKKVYFDGTKSVTASETIGIPTLDQAAVGALRRTSVSNPYLGKIYAVAFGVGQAPAPRELYLDWINGRFSGLVSVPARQPLLGIVNGGHVLVGGK